MKNFHLPLPEGTYNQLRSEAEKENLPATVLAREAIDAYLRERRRAETDLAITAYAMAVAGSEDDLHTGFESAAVESWLGHESDGQ